MTALAQAVVERRWQQAKLLMDIGCSVNGKADNGRTPLIELCFVDDQNKAAAFTSILLEKGADIDARDKDGRTALSNACLLHKNKLFSLLIKFVDFDLNSADKDGNTALFHAITAGDVHIIKELLAKLLHFGLKVDVLNKKGETPLIYALKSKKLDIAEVLINEGKPSLEVRDSEFQKSASQWREEIRASCRTVNNLTLLPLLPKSSSAEQKSKRESQKNNTKTGSAKLQLRSEQNSFFPQLSSRPATAPERIVVPHFLRPCLPIKTSLVKLYMIHNQQKTHSFRYGYKPVKYKAQETQAISTNKSSVTFSQVNELTVTLQGLYKDSVNKRGFGSPSSNKAMASRGGLGERSTAKGAKVLKTITKSLQQLEPTKPKETADTSGPR